MKPNKLVIKVGTSTLTAGTQRLNRRRMLSIAQQIVEAREKGVSVILVTSGAIAAGRELMEHAGNAPINGARSLPVKQMLAAVGQAHLMLAWGQVFGMFDVQVGQVLLTRADLSDRRRYLNARDTLNAMLTYDVVPIINENDAVATEEIRVGDNDNLSALVANVVNADLLLILSDIAGLYTADPHQDPSATLVREVTHIDEAVWAMAGASRSGLGVGGMATKLRAAELATHSGTAMMIVDGARPNVILDAIEGKPVGTRFAATSTKIESRKRWILSERAVGSVIVDDGAAGAVRNGRSLLPVGVREVQGDFDRGEAVLVKDLRGRTIAHGIARYSAAEASLLIGKQSWEIEGILGYESAPMLIHADDMVVLAMGNQSDH
ncbi:MAG: glutamate 5-kinase [Anaerolineae bacterium]|nr:glutamate 5-kinase [Thermoflexales bacterium]MDW8408061.1 glutamate 5-kinase [Anaerolineae bacterium]